MARLLFALGIRHVGENVARTLVEYYPSLDTLAAASQEELQAVPAIGPKIAASIVSYFREEPEPPADRELRAAGVRMAEEARARITTPLGR